MRWDAHFSCLCVEILQFKTGKVKVMIFVSSPVRHMCFYLHFGDLLVMKELRPYMPDDTWRVVVP